MKKKFSFTLVEILTVVAIIGILAGMTLGITSYVGERNREVQTQTTIKMLEMALEQYKTKHGSYPLINGAPNNTITDPYFKLPLSSSNANELSKLFTDISYDSSNNITGIKGLNIIVQGNNVIILDGWGSPIVYVYPGVFNRTKYDLGSAGSDKLLGEDAGSKFTNDGEEVKFPVLGERTNKNGAYRKHFGKADDITNFKRTDR